MLDKHGRTIEVGDILLGEFHGHGGAWYEYAIVRDSPDLGMVLELEGHYLRKFTHPKFCKPERREITDKLPKAWNSIDRWNIENDASWLVRKCDFCDEVCRHSAD